MPNGNQKPVGHCVVLTVHQRCPHYRGEIIAYPPARRSIKHLSASVILSQSQIPRIIPGIAKETWLPGQLCLVVILGNLEDNIALDLATG